MTSGVSGNSDEPKIFFIADNHFSDYDGPDSVISIFHRPFKDAAEMNAEMIRRWNETVSPEDTVFSLGDFSWCMEDFSKYAPLLNGRKIFLQGNHDMEGDEPRRRLRMPSRVLLVHDGHQLLLVHDPATVPAWWKGTVLHGHHHWMEEYPFIDPDRQNVNVAAERVNYTPVPLEYILEHIEERMETYEPD